MSRLPLFATSCVLLLGLSSMSQAAQPGPYLGAGVGESDDEILNESASAYKLFAGVNLAPYIGLEFSYVDLGEFANRQLWQDGIAYEVVGYLPMAPNLDLIVRGGFFDWQVADRFSSVSGTDATFGLGVQAQLNRHLSLRGEYQSFFDVDGGDVDLLSASLSFHF